jgi:hypothetical protein
MNLEVIFPELNLSEPFLLGVATMRMEMSDKYLFMIKPFKRFIHPSLSSSAALASD